MLFRTTSLVVTLLSFFVAGSFAANVLPVSPSNLQSHRGDPQIDPLLAALADIKDALDQSKADRVASLADAKTTIQGIIDGLPPSDIIQGRRSLQNAQLQSHGGDPQIDPLLAALADIKDALDQSKADRVASLADAKTKIQGIIDGLPPSDIIQANMLLQNIAAEEEGSYRRMLRAVQ